jgi:hypothetical protein
MDTHANRHSNCNRHATNSHAYTDADVFADRHRDNHPHANADQHAVTDVYGNRHRDSFTHADADENADRDTDQDAHQDAHQEALTEFVDKPARPIEDSPRWIWNRYRCRQAPASTRRPGSKQRRLSAMLPEDQERLGNVLERLIEWHKMRAHGVCFSAPEAQTPVLRLARLSKDEQQRMAKLMLRVLDLCEGADECEVSRKLGLERSPLAD